MKPEAPSAAVELLEAGPFTTIQDSGRFGYRRFGVPVSGALDASSLSLANRRVGNRPEAAALEVFHGPTAMTALESCLVSHAGSAVRAFVDGDVVKENPLRVQSGSTLKLESRGDSTIFYVAFAGGIWADEVMGSMSTYVRAKFGGRGGRVLREGDQIFVFPPSSEGASTRVDAMSETPKAHRVVLGPHAELFPTESLQSFFKAEYRVSFSSDRMGYRLEGLALRGFRDWGRVLTLPVFPGMVQITPDGLPIVLMADCQTTGGYPVIAMVLGPDLCALAQKSPGSSVSFQEVSDGQASGILESFGRTTGFSLRPKE
jgi:biotin-dependent carboxylase-like uncharacterized protein